MARIGKNPPLGYMYGAELFFIMRLGMLLYGIMYFFLEKFTLLSLSTKNATTLFAIIVMLLLDSIVTYFFKKKEHEFFHAYKKLSPSTIRLYRFYSVGSIVFLVFIAPLLLRWYVK